MNEVPQLLVEWSSPWQEFVSAIGTALRRSPPKIRAEASVGLFPWRGLLVAVLVEVAAMLATAVAHPVEGNALAALEQVPRSHDVIFFSANELPRTPDLGGAPVGSEGKSGGSSIHHAAQTIKVARGESLRERVIDAPQLNLPKSDSAIQNLLAYKAEAGPPPAEALSMRHSPSFAMPVVPPPPELRQSRLRSTVCRPTGLLNVLPSEPCSCPAVTSTLRPWSSDWECRRDWCGLAAPATPLKKRSIV